MARLALCLFGPFQLTLASRPATTFESDKARALLAFLAVEADHPHRREKLAGLLWPDSTERSARANLAHVLAHLRTLLGDREAEDPVLLITRQTVQWNPAAGARVDAAKFVQRLQRPAASRGPCAWPAQDRPPVASLEEALALYRGPFLDGFSLPDSAPFEEWALLERERLQRLALDALQQLVDGLEAQGETARALAFAWRGIELDPWREAAQRQVMRLLARDGQRAAALAHYDSWRARLAEELDAPPSPETEALYGQIRDGTFSPQGPTTSAPPRAPPHNLPAPLTPFVGRAAELAQLAERLEDPTCRLLTILGPGGIGKTRLALEAARARLPHFPDGVFQVRLAGLASTEGLVPAIATALGLRFALEKDPRQQLVDHLESRTLLLVLDNFEHLLDGAGLLADILRAAPRVKMVVTSRARLHLQGEALLPLGGLAYPALAPAGAGSGPVLADIAAYDAVKLFVDGARRVCPAFELDGQTLEVARICRLLAGVPLALLLASAWAGELPPAEIATRLSDGVGRSLDLLEAEWSDVPDRHRSMRAAFDHSWRLLSPREQAIFAALSVFHGGFDATAAEAVADASPADLRRLVDRSFLQRLPAPPALSAVEGASAAGPGGRFEVHELMRQFAAEKLEADPEADEWAHDRHCAYYAARLEAWDAELQGALQTEVLDRIDHEIDNARAAWEWAVVQGQVKRIDRAMYGLGRFYYWRHRNLESDSACRLAIDRLWALVSRAPASAPSGSGVEAAYLLRVTARVLGLGLRVCGAERRDDLYRRALAILDRPELSEHDMRSERAMIQSQMARHFDLSNPAKALRLLEESLALRRELDDRYSMSSNLLNLAEVLLRLPAFGEATEQRWAQAKSVLEESLLLARELGHVRGEALALCRLSTVALLQGRGVEGERLLERCVTACTETGDAIFAAGNLEQGALTLLLQGRFAEGCLLMDEAIRLSQELGDRKGEMVGRNRLAELLGYDGAYGKAQAEARGVIALAHEIQEPLWTASARFSLGLAAMGEGRWAEAQCEWEQYAAYNRAQGRDHNLALARAFQAVAAVRLGNPAGARRHVAEALRLCTSGGNLTTATVALAALSVLLLEAGRAEEAVEIYASVHRLPHYERCKLWADLAGRPITAAAEGLPPDVVAAAQERGRARDLMATAREMLEMLETEPMPAPDRMEA